MLLYIEAHSYLDNELKPAETASNDVAEHLTIVVTRLPDPLRNQNDLQLS